MNLINIQKTTINDEMVNSVDARGLHRFLESQQEFATWIKAKVLHNPYFEENQDYVLLDKNVTQTGSGGHNRKDYALTMDTAKKVAMASNTPRGNQARDYFLQCERKVKSLSMIPDFNNPAIAARAWADQIEAKQALQLEMEEQAPMVEFAKAVQISDRNITMNDMAKLDGRMGRNTLMDIMRDEGILMVSNLPYQRFLNSGYFEICESVVQRSRGNQINLSTQVTPKGQAWMIKKINEWTEA